MINVKKKNDELTELLIQSQTESGMESNSGARIHFYYFFNAASLEVGEYEIWRRSRLCTRTPGGADDVIGQSCPRGAGGGVTAGEVIRVDL